MKNKRKPSGKKLALMILNVVLAVIFTALLSVTIYVEWILGRFYRDPSQEVTLTPEQIQAVLQEDMEATRPSGVTEIKPEDVDWGQVEQVESADHILNVLLIGQDRRPGEVRARSDTMILITVNTRDYTITMTSFMRDLYVQIPGNAPNRLNVPYVFGGYDLLADTMEKNFGIRPDRFVEVDFDGFEAVVDAVGGIELYVTAAEAAYLNRHHTDWQIKEGVNHLNGKQALGYARNRTVGGDGDFGRTQRQRNVLNAILEKAKRLDLLQINELLLALTDVLTTDMTSAEIMSYVVQFYPKLEKLSTPTELRIPYGNSYYSAWADGIGSVLVPNLETNSAVLAETQK